MRLLIISFSPLHNDPRVYRQLIQLKNTNLFNITAAGYSEPNINKVNFLKIRKVKQNYLNKTLAACKLKCKLYENYYWKDPSVADAFSKLNNKKFNLIIANDINTLPLAVKLSTKNGAKVLLDCHEYTPREFDDRFIFNYFLKDYWNYICSTYIPRVDATTTVCQGIADEYKKNYGGDWHVITNAPFFEKLNPKPVENDEIRIIHHGGLNPTRNIEKMINLVDLLDDRFKLDFMFVNSNPGYLRKLKQIAKNNSRIHFRKPVPMNEIVCNINNYDIGLYLLAPAGFNNLMALPNKLFEFIQARLVVAIWPSPEMSKIINSYSCGVVSDDFSIEAMAKALNALSNEDIMHYKMNSAKAAEYLCAEKNGELLNHLVIKLLS